MHQSSSLTSSTLSLLGGCWLVFGGTLMCSLVFPVSSIKWWVTLKLLFTDTFSLKNKTLPASLTSTAGSYFPSSFALSLDCNSNTEPFSISSAHHIFFLSLPRYSRMAAWVSRDLHHEIQHGGALCPAAPGDINTQTSGLSLKTHKHRRNICSFARRTWR